MVNERGFFDLARVALMLLAVTLVLLYCGRHLLVSDTGFIAGVRYDHQISELAPQAAALVAERERLERRLALTDEAGGFDQDYAEELVRRRLKVIAPNEFIVPLPEVD